MVVGKACSAIDSSADYLRLSPPFLFFLSKSAQGEKINNFPDDSQSVFHFSLQLVVSLMLPPPPPRLPTSTPAPASGPVRANDLFRHVDSDLSDNNYEQQRLRRKKQNNKLLLQLLR